MLWKQGKPPIYDKTIPDYKAEARLYGALLKTQGKQFYTIHAIRRVHEKLPK